MIKWKVFKTARKPKIAVNNLMNIYNWSKAVKYIELKKKIKIPQNEKATYQIAIERRLELMEAVEVYSIERRK